MTYLYRADTTLLNVLRVECPEGTAYPAQDADKKTIFENTHFADAADAWSRLMGEVEAGVSLAGSSVQQIRKRLQDANQRAADAVVEYATVRDRYRKWQRAREQAGEPAEGECDE